MSYNIVAIPTYSQKEMLCDLVDQLLKDESVNEIFVFDNSPRQEAPSWLGSQLGFSPSRLRVIGALDRAIYEMWNAALDIGHMMSNLRRVNKKEDPTYLAILNDDLVLPDRFIETLARGLDSDEKVWCVYPDWHRFRADQPPPDVIQLTSTQGTGHNYAMSGWAFMLRGDIILNPLPLIDLQFQWWCGDDDIEYNIRKAGGKVARVEGLGITHYGSQTVRNMPEERHGIGWEDVARFKAKYGENAW